MEQRKCLFTVGEVAEHTEHGVDVKWVHFHSYRRSRQCFRYNSDFELNRASLNWNFRVLVVAVWPLSPRNPKNKRKTVYLFRSIVIMDFLFGFGFLLFFFHLVWAASSFGIVNAVIHYTHSRPFTFDGEAPDHDTHSICIYQIFISFIYLLFLSSDATNSADTEKVSHFVFAFKSKVN